ncbi:MAG: site-specific DNA-methyltransferase, partial [Verrucomicrobia bacterium]|nr:site-specific DNA-methyltransferase [Verrucomicrobiota bacterium]
MEEYKSFEVERNGLDSAILDQLSVKYPKKDIFFEWIEDSIIVHLNQVDFSAFKKDIETLAQSQSANSSTETLFAILDGIESIRSYGLKGKKRLYVSYNKERKVKNRTRKVEKR